MPKTPMPLEAPELQEISFDLSHMEPYREYIVLLYNDDSHSMEEVTVQLYEGPWAAACREPTRSCSRPTARARPPSSSPPKHAPAEVASILREIDLKVTVRQVN